MRVPLPQDLQRERKEEGEGLRVECLYAYKFLCGEREGKVISQWVKDNTSGKRC